MAATLIINGKAAREKLKYWADRAPINTVAVLRKAKRTVPQNDRMWAMLSDISAQCTIYGEPKTTEQWKAIFMHALKIEVGIERGINGDWFPYGFKSSKLNKEQMSDLMEYISAYGAEQGVVFQEPV